MSAYGSHLIPQADVPGSWANPGQTPLITTQHRKSLALTQDGGPISLRGGARVWGPYSYQVQSGDPCSVIHVGRGPGG